jgi:chromosome segregation ATPase
LKRELKDSKDHGDKLSKIVSEQTKKIEKLNEGIRGFKQECRNKESRIAMDLEEYKKLQHDKEEIEEKLNKIKNEYFVKLQLEWENKNKKSQTEYQTLISNIKDRSKEVEKLDKEIFILKNTEKVGINKLISIMNILMRR